LVRTPNAKLPDEYEANVRAEYLVGQRHEIRIERFLVELFLAHPFVPKQAASDDSFSRRCKFRGVLVEVFLPSRLD